MNEKPAGLSSEVQIASELAAEELPGGTEEEIWQLTKEILRANRTAHTARETMSPEEISALRDLCASSERLAERFLDLEKAMAEVTKKITEALDRAELPLLYHNQTPTQKI